MTARVQAAWKSFRELAGVLVGRNGCSLKARGVIYKTCVRSVLVYGSETWEMKVDDLRRLECTERRMLRWICGVRLTDRVRTAELYERMGVEEAIDRVVENRRLQWYGHVLRRDEGENVRRVLDIEVDGRKKKGRPKKTWMECVRRSMKTRGLKIEDSADRRRWRAAVRSDPANPGRPG